MAAFIQGTSSYSISVKMALSRYGCLLLLMTVSSCVSLSNDEPLMTFDVLYNAGIESYVQERPVECASYMSRAIADYKTYQQNLIECRLTCESRSKNPDKYLSTEELAMRGTFTELSFFEMALRRSDCLRRCKKDKLAGRPESVDQEIMEEFEKLQPYDYLQICAYKSGDYKTAAAASFTFLLANPNHETMQKNVQFYRTLSTVSKDDFYNMELKKHQDLYMKGVDSYAEKRYSDTIRNIEAALEEYYKEYSHCSALCEGSYDHESFPDFYNAVADHWIHVLRCKQQCPIKLATINGALVDNFLVEHYNYLQFSYYQEKDLKAAAACAATYLLMKPNDETMKQNKEFYLTMKGLEESDFRPRVEAADHVHRQRFQQSMLDFVNRRYKFSDADEDKGSEEEKTIIEESEVIDPNKFRDPSYYSPERRDREAFGPRDHETELRFKKRLQELGATLYASEEEMAGKQRFVVDNLLTEDQCQTISELAKFGYGGYELGKLPTYIKYEAYDGLKVTSIKEMIENHTIDTSVAELYFHTIDTMMDLISLYFNVKWPMYIDFVHTACKNPVVDEDGEPKAEYYQKLHSDNCKYREGLPCDKSFPARFWREFTAVMYLNEVDGGEFVFVDENENVTHKVVPKCGRLAVFNSTDRHGVLAYKDKKRCTIGLWTTLDPNHHDKKVDYAKTAINIVKHLDDNLPLKEFIEPRGIKLNLTEEELNGPERFAVDSVITQEECDALIHLANIGGVAGDGYSSGGLTSVNTENERFAGLTVAKAAELAAQGKVKSEWVKLYMEKSKLVKEIVQRYFKLKTPLYFDYTHLVCRTSMHDKNKIRTDLSHPIHSDNCIIQSDNTCKKAPPAYVQRDYSALLYLNDNFTGGEFIFTHQNMTIQSMVKPWCGFAMAFNAGNYHGVQAVTSGQRCALAAWYTLDKRFDEAAHVKAKNIMNNLEGKPLGPPQSSHIHGEL